MRFPNPFARGQKIALDIAPGSVLWGVRRRGESDDARVHYGLTQHAFIAGNDSRALCGFRPYRWGGPAVPLTLARDANPQCRKCLNVIRISVSADMPELDPIPLLTAELATVEASHDVAAASHDVAAPSRPAPGERARRKTSRRSGTRSARASETPALPEWPPVVAGA